MFKLTALFFFLSLLAAVIGFTTDIDYKVITIARYACFACIGLTLLSAIIGGAIKRNRLQRDLRY